jgi:hypothetical protein
MKRKMSYEITDTFLDKIISVAYNDASLFDKIKIFRAVAIDSKVRELYSTYKKTAWEVKQLQKDVCPEEFLKSIELKTIQSTKKRDGFLLDLFSIIYNRPVISALTTLILIISIITALIINKPIKYNYSQAEIMKADKEARYALELVGKVFKQTNSTFQQEVLGEKVSRPFRESIGFVNNLFKGEKNEIN